MLAFEKKKTMELEKPVSRLFKKSKRGTMTLKLRSSNRKGKNTN